MLRSVTSLKHLIVRAADGDAGRIADCYFDDETWAVRYLVVNAGSWLAERMVLISPVLLVPSAWDANTLDIKLTRSQVENSPDIDTHKPVSRLHEARYMDYYNYPYYWGGPFLWGATPLPFDPLESARDASAQKNAAESGDTRLRSAAAVSGYEIEAADGNLGSVKDFLVDPESWAIRYIEVDTGNWLPGKKVLVSPQWIGRVSWDEARVYVNLARETMRNAPEYEEARQITPSYEQRLHAYYGAPS